MLHGCIPVIIQDGVQLPYENVLDYESFSLRIPEDKLTRVPAVLRNVPPGVVKMMQANLAKVWYRFRWVGGGSDGVLARLGWAGRGRSCRCCGLRGGPGGCGAVRRRWGGARERGRRRAGVGACAAAVRAVLKPPLLPPARRWNQHKWVQQTARQLAGQRNMSLELEKPPPGPAERSRRALGLQQAVEPELDAMQTLVEFLYGKMMSWGGAKAGADAAGAAGPGSSGGSTGSSAAGAGVGSGGAAGAAGSAVGGTGLAGGSGSAHPGAPAAVGGAGLLQGILGAVSDSMAGVLGGASPVAGAQQALAQVQAAAQQAQVQAQQVQAQQVQAQQVQQAQAQAQQDVGSDAAWHAAAAVQGGAVQPAAAAGAPAPAAAPALAAVVTGNTSTTASSSSSASSNSSSSGAATGSHQPAIKLGSLQGLPSGLAQALPRKASGVGLIQEQDYEDAVPLA